MKTVQKNMLPFMSVYELNSNITFILFYSYIMVYIVDHTIRLPRVSHTINLPTLFTIIRVASN